MKKTMFVLALLAASLAVFTGCANAKKKATSLQSFQPKAAELQNGVVVPEITATNQIVTSPSNTVSTSYVNIKYVFTGYSNSAAIHPGLDLTFTSLPGKKVDLGSYTWSDDSFGAIHSFFTDPQASAVDSSVENQAALGGGHKFSTGSYTQVVDTNTASIITATGSAAGAVVGQLIKTTTTAP